MRELTEQQEQQMIDRAKAGDPEANYELSLWALERSEEEPEEPRWNRLAAKCLVKAAQAGYAPAQKRMASLLQEKQSRPEPEPEDDEPEPERTPSRPQPARSRHAAPSDEPVSIHKARRARPQQTVTARRPAPPEPEDDEPQAYPDDGYDDGYDDETRKARPARAKGGKGPFSNWGAAQWRRLEIVCVIICAALLLAIFIMLFTSRAGGDHSGTSSIPPAGEAGPATATDTPVPASDYPDEATRAEIAAADLDIPPMEEDFRAGPTTATVSVNSDSLRLRRGPNTSYSELVRMPDGSKVEVFADKNDWSLVRYYGDDGAVYGWCSSTYLMIDAAAVEITAPDAGAAG